MPSARVFGAVAASFVVGALAGAGSLWLVHDREQTASYASSQEPAPANTPAFVPPQAITYDPDKVTIEYQIVTDGIGESISSVALFNRDTHLQLRRSEVPAATLRLSGLRKVVTRLRTVRARREQSGC